MHSRSIFVRGSTARQERCKHSLFFQKLKPTSDIEVTPPYTTHISRSTPLQLRHACMQRSKNLCRRSAETSAEPRGLTTLTQEFPNVHSLSHKKLMLICFCTRNDERARSLTRIPGQELSLSLAPRAQTSQIKELGKQSAVRGVANEITPHVHSTTTSIYHKLQHLVG